MFPVSGNSVTSKGARLIFVFQFSGKKSESKQAEIPESESESQSVPEKTTTPETTAKSLEIDETQFRKNVHDIDQCMFAVDSSSEEEEEIIEIFDSKEAEYANQLSLEENMSQEEILRLIKQQNAAARRSEPPKSNISSVKRPISNWSEDEDDPDVVEPNQKISPLNTPSSSFSTIGSDWNSPNENATAGTSVASTKVEGSNENYEKSLSTLDEKMNSVGGSPNEPCCSKMLGEKLDAQSEELFSDSDSEDLIEVTADEVKSQYFGEAKPNETLEISIDPDNIGEDEDLFADVFTSGEKDSVGAVEEQKVESSTEKVQTTSLNEDVEKKCAKMSANFAELYSEKKSPAETSKSSSELLLESEKMPVLEDNISATSEERILRAENEQKKENTTDSKTVDRVKKIADIFKKVVSYFSSNIDPMLSIFINFFF